MSPLTTFDEEIGLDEKMIYYNKILVAMGPLFVTKSKF